MIELTATTQYLRTRRYRIKLTDKMIENFNRGITVENQLHNFAVRYLEKTFGRKHLNRPYPITRTDRVNLIKDHILPGFKAKIGFGADRRWDKEVIGLFSQAAHEFLKTLIVNFGEYRKTLKEANRWTDAEKKAYLNNQDDNPQHRTWYRRGSLRYLRNGASHRAISFPKNGNQIRVVSPHWIKIPDFGDIQVIENIGHLRHQPNITTARIKQRGDGSFELQLVFKDAVPRKTPQTMIGADWNMNDDKVFHTSANEKIFLNPQVSALADQYEQQINLLKSRHDRQAVWLNPHSRRLQRLEDQIRYYNARQANLLTENYRHIAKQLFEHYDLIALEKLATKAMRKGKRRLGKKGNRAKNRKLAKVKPFELGQLLTQVANREGKTLVRVDSYKTSQVEFGTPYQEKHDPSIREWTSRFTGKRINRDLNASQNILVWALEPQTHIKYLERQAAIKAAKAKRIPEDKQPKVIKPSYLVEIN